MLYSGFYLVQKTQISQRIINTWAICATNDKCLAPPDAQLKCQMNKLKKGIYANCHRFDQSALSIMLYQCNSDVKKISRSAKILDIGPHGDF